MFDSIMSTARSHRMIGEGGEEYTTCAVNHTGSDKHGHIPLFADNTIKYYYLHCNIL